MIRSRIRRLRLEKEEREGRRLSNRVIAEETGLSEGVILRLSNSAFTKISTETIEKLCSYFGCTVGELLEYVPPSAAAAVTAAATNTLPAAVHGREGLA
jgi:putative transcriptional regulator